MLTYVSYAVDLLAGFSVWLASTESNFVRRRVLSEIWDVDELKANKDGILKGNFLKIEPRGWQ